MGANGAGKSTLVKILTGAVRADSGSITIRGTERIVRSPTDARRAGMVSVYQDPSVIPDLDIHDNLRLTGTPVDAFRSWVAELGIARLDLADYARDLPLPTLRIIDLARALAHEPDILLMDETTAALPADLTERVLEVVGRQRASGSSVIFISHRLIEISALCDRATVLRDGETVGVVDMGPGAEDRIVGLMLGPVEHEVTTAAAAAAPEPHATVSSTAIRLAVQGLRAGTKLSDVSFELRTGEVLGVVALEGQGQEELFEVLAGSRRPGGGDITRGRSAGQLPASCGRHPRRPRVRARRPPGGAAATAFRAREHRAAVLVTHPRLGSHPGRHREAHRRRRHRASPDRHPCPVRGPAAVGRQPAEGDHRSLDRRRASRRCSASTPPGASTSGPSARSTPCSVSWPRLVRPCCCTPPSWRRSSSSVTAPSSSSAAGWWTRCPPRRPTSRPCCARHMVCRRVP